MLSSPSVDTHNTQLIGNSMADTSALRSVGCVHVLAGLVTFAIGVVSGALYLYMGWLCVGIWTGISFLICGIISIIAGKSTNTLTVLFMACVNVLTLNFAFTGAVITFSSLFPDPHFYSVKEGYANGVVHNQTTGTAVGITHLVVSFIEIVTCITGVRISWKIMTSSINAEGYRRTQSYDEPYTSMDSYSMPSSSQTQRRTLENPTPPPTYDAATHSLSTSPKTVNVNRTRANRYGSLTDTQTDISDVF